MESIHGKQQPRRHLNRQIVAACFILTVALCVLLTVVGYVTLRNAMTERYETELDDILRITMAQIDVADLETCMETGVESEKFDELTRFFDSVRQNSSLEYVVIVQPVKVGDEYDVLAVASGLLPEERAGESQRQDMAIPKLGESTGAAYPPDFIPMIYDDMINREDVKFSSSSTAYGDTFDAATSIRNEQGEGIALLTAGMASDAINATMTRYLMAMIVFGLIVNGMFLLFMTAWFRRRVIQPIRHIERAAGEFTQKSRSLGGSQALVLDLSDIRTGDELESLAGSLETMSQDMKEYVEDLLSSAVRIEGMRREIERVSDIAMTDALTGVRNKAAFNEECERLDAGIADGTANFALMMFDLNNLKHVNDTYGHEKGDVYITTACDAICETFVHSPVFRIGGDEFVTVLERGDLAARDELVERLNGIMRESAGREEWQRVSVAAGLAVFDPDKDDSAQAVLLRADKAMYATKATMK